MHKPTRWIPFQLAFAHSKTALNRWLQTTGSSSSSSRVPCMHMVTVTAPDTGSIRITQPDQTSLQPSLDVNACLQSQPRESKIGTNHGRLFHSIIAVIIGEAAWVPKRLLRSVGAPTRPLCTCIVNCNHVMYPHMISLFWALHGCVPWGALHHPLSQKLIVAPRLISDIIDTVKLKWDADESWLCSSELRSKPRILGGSRRWWPSSLCLVVFAKR